jgi:hypothetical protein
VYRLRDVKLAEQYCYSAFVMSPGVAQPTTSVSNNSLDSTSKASSPRGPAPVSITGRRGGASFGSPASVAATVAAIAPKTVTKRPTGSTADKTMGGRGSKAVSGSNRTSACLTDLIIVLLIPPRGYEALQEEAIRVLDSYSEYISPLSVMEALPGDVKFTAIAPYIAHIAVRNANARTIGEITRRSMQARVFELERLKIALQGRSVYVDKERYCVVCGKPLSNAIFAVFPNLRTAHFRCFKDKECDPQRGVPFRPVVDTSI